MQQYRFEGEWDNDAPNGYGVEVILGSPGSQDYELTRSGMLVNGLWNGHVIMKSTEIPMEYTTYVYENGKLVLLGEPRDSQNNGNLYYPCAFVENDETRFVYIIEWVFNEIHGISGFVRR